MEQYDFRQQSDQYLSAKAEHSDPVFLPVQAASLSLFAQSSAAMNARVSSNPQHFLFACRT
ncbi:MAG TPA: hypothetical protein VJK54_10325 [Chthoniobacterales bacterium]|nr:hypothetical protein [Chthoniobacterales bacterium]